MGILSMMIVLAIQQLHYLISEERATRGSPETNPDYRPSKFFNRNARLELGWVGLRLEPVNEILLCELILFWTMIRIWFVHAVCGRPLALVKIKTKLEFRRREGWEDAGRPMTIREKREVLREWDEWQRRENSGGCRSLFGFPGSSAKVKSL